MAPQREIQEEAFREIADDMNHTYTLTYTPKPNDNEGWRRISVEVLDPALTDCKVEARRGYRAHRLAGD